MWSCTYIERNGMRQVVVYWKTLKAGVLTEKDKGFSFSYDTAYLALPEARAISLTMPLQEAPFLCKTLHPFFDGLIPEGWLLDIAQKNWKIDDRDRMALLMACCRDCIGAVSVEPLVTQEDDD